MLIKNFKLKIKNCIPGFTLVEILVATFLFVIVTSATSGLFVSTLRLNRRSDAVRQATESMRNFVEFIAKEIRNGQVDYGFIDPPGVNESVYYANHSNALGPCNNNAALSSGEDTGGDVYTTPGADNKFGLIDNQGNEECIYLAYGPGAGGGHTEGEYVGTGIFSPTANNPNPVLATVRTDVNDGGSWSPITPPNSFVEQAAFFVRPAKDPYYSTGSAVAVQPYVQMSLRFVIQLPTGERVPINYQTAVSTNKYDVPNN